MPLHLPAERPCKSRESYIHFSFTKNTNIFESHSWNIDGYKIQERIITTKSYYGDILAGINTDIEKRMMVHCDYGWGGFCNGYYVLGVFKLDDSNSEKDYPEKGSDSTNYDSFLKVIIYDMP